MLVAAFNLTSTHLNCATAYLNHNHHHTDTTTAMGAVKARKSKGEREDSIRRAKHAYLQGEVASIREAATAYDVPYSTLRDRLKGAQPRQIAHAKEQLLTPAAEEVLVRYIKLCDEWGHPLKVKYVKAYANSLLVDSGRKVGQHWISRFLDRHSELASKFTQRLDRQRRNAESPGILKDHFRKVNTISAIF